jgi:hypothetical protein
VRGETRKNKIKVCERKEWKLSNGIEVKEEVKLLPIYTNLREWSPRRKCQLVSKRECNVWFSFYFAFFVGFLLFDK